MVGPFTRAIGPTHASTRACYVVVISVTEFSPAAAARAAAAKDVNECPAVSGVSARGR
jgi:hypothetical protein